MRTSAVSSAVARPAIAQENARDSIDPGKALFDAVGKHELSRVREILRLYPQAIAYQNDEGSTPLHAAICAAFNREIVDVLLQHGADVAITNLEGDTCMHLAMSVRPAEPTLVSLLLGQDERLGNSNGVGALHALNKAGKSALDLAKDDNGRYSYVAPDHELIFLDLTGRVAREWRAGIATSLVAAVRADQPEAVEKLVEKAGTDWNLHSAVTNQYETVLHVAMKEGKSEVFVKVVELAQARGDLRVLTEPQSVDGLAAHYTAPETNPSLEMRRAMRRRWTPLTMAIIYGRPDWADRLLCAGVDVNSRDALGLTALHWASSEGKAAMVDWLIAKGAHVENRANDHAMTPMMMAAQSADIDTVKSLVKAGGNINGRDARGRTPLMGAYLAGRLPEFCSSLVTVLGADPDAVDADGHAATYYQRASTTNLPKVAKSQCTLL